MVEVLSPEAFLQDAAEPTAIGVLMGSGNCGQQCLFECVHVYAQPWDFCLGSVRCETEEQMGLGVLMGRVGRDALEGMQLGLYGASVPLWRCAPLSYG